MGHGICDRDGGALRNAENGKAAPWTLRDGLEIAYEAIQQSLSRLVRQAVASAVIANDGFSQRSVEAAAPDRLSNRIQDASQFAAFISTGPLLTAAYAILTLSAERR
jgi:hypothetical protein